VDGEWTVVYAKRDGKKMDNKDDKDVVTLRDNVLDYKRDSKQPSIKLDFGPNQTVRAWALSNSQGDLQAGRATNRLTPDYTGVCIVTAEYLCISLNPASGNTLGAITSQDTAPSTGPGKVGGIGTGISTQPENAAWVMILRRQQASR
jgi:hypothetical protein